MDERTLNAIAQRALKRKARWRPPTIESGDLLQEAFLAVLEASQAGTTDPVELQVAAERHLTNVIRREANRRTVPVADLDVDE